MNLIFQRSQQCNRPTLLQYETPGLYLMLYSTVQHIFGFVHCFAAGGLESGSIGCKASTAVTTVQTDGPQIYFQNQILVSGY